VIFGALLIWTGIQLARHRNEDPDPMDNAIIRSVRKRFAFSEEYDGTRLFTRVSRPTPSPCWAFVRCTSSFAVCSTSSSTCLRDSRSSLCSSG
jgi:hypothetical protein